QGNRLMAELPDGRYGRKDEQQIDECFHQSALFLLRCHQHLISGFFVNGFGVSRVCHGVLSSTPSNMQAPCQPRCRAASCTAKEISETPLSQRSASDVSE